MVQTTNIFFPSSSKFKLQVLKENDDSLSAGHVGFFKSYYNIRQSFFWKGMWSKIQKYVEECDTCQWQNFETISPLFILQPLHIPTKKWYEISMEFIIDLPTSDGKDDIFVIVHWLTKYAHFLGISSKAKTIKVVDSYVKIIFKLHGFPKVIISDRDPKFTSNFWKELFCQVGTSLTMSTSYHPQTYGQTKVVKKCLEGYLRNFVNDRHTQWINWLHLVEWWYNSTYHTSTKMSPFEALYGYPPTSIEEYVINYKFPIVKDYLAASDEVLHTLKYYLKQERN